MKKYKVLAAILLAAAMMTAGCGGQTAAPKEEAAQTEAVQQEEAKQEEAAPAETEQQAEAEQQGEAAPAEATQNEAAPAEADAGQNSEASSDLDGKYESEDGWFVRYDSSMVEMEETEEGVNFTYTGKSSGINSVGFYYFMNRMPDEVLYDAIANEDGLPDHTRSEGYFAGREDVWSMRVAVTPEEGSDDSQEFIAVEHNGGTLLVQIDSHKEADEMTAMRISDTISAILDSFEFTDHEPQTYSEYVPGKYVQEYEEEIDGKTVTAEYFVELKEDHTGVISFQDEVPVIWYSREGILLNAETGEQIYEYVIEGNVLILIEETDGDDPAVFEFEKE